MLINLEFYSFFEKYGLADLIYSYFKDNNIKISNYNIELLEDTDLINYYNGVYNNKLKNEFFTILKGEKYEYGSLSDLDKTSIENKKPNTNIGEYMSSHILSTDKEKMSLYSNIEKNNNNLSYIKSINPFSTKINSLYKTTYNDFIDKLHKISSICAVCTRNKYSYYSNDEGYISFIPEFDNLIDYIKFIEFINSQNIKLGKTGFNLINKKISRPKRQWDGNFNLFIIKNNISDNDFYNNKIKFFNMYLSFKHYLKILEITDINPINWYKISSGNISYINIPNILNNLNKYDISDLEKSYEEFVFFDNEYDKNIINFFNFLENNNSYTLNKILLNHVIFNQNNIFIQEFINKTNMKDEQLKLIKDFIKSINGALYFKAKEYVDNDTNFKAIKIKKFKLIDDLKSLFDRNNNIISLFGDISDFYKKHNIFKQIENIAEIIDLTNELNYDEFKDICKSLLHSKIKNNTKETI